MGVLASTRSPVAPPEAEVVVATSGPTPHSRAFTAPASEHHGVVGADAWCPFRPPAAPRFGDLPRL
jgi:hypothetical protein